MEAESEEEDVNKVVYLVDYRLAPCMDCGHVRVGHLLRFHGACRDVDCDCQAFSNKEAA